MNHGIEFEVNGIRKHSFDDWGLWLSPLEHIYPQLKTSYTDIVGGNGSIDHTDIFGKVYFKDRKFPIKFTCIDKIRYDERLREIVTFLHGKEVKFFVYDDELYYFKGRLSVNKYTSSKAIGTIVIDAITEPFKYKYEVTVQTNTITEKGVITYKNNRMEVCPKFKASAPMTFEFNGNSYALDTTETLFPSIEFVEGDNVIVWHGNGVVEVSYQEGVF